MKFQMQYFSYPARHEQGEVYVLSKTFPVEIICSENIGFHSH